MRPVGYTPPLRSRGRCRVALVVLDQCLRLLSVAGVRRFATARGQSSHDVATHWSSTTSATRSLLPKSGCHSRPIPNQPLQITAGQRFASMVEKEDERAPHTCSIAKTPSRRHSLAVIGLTCDACIIGTSLID